MTDYLEKLAQATVPCPTCKGEGKDEWRYECETCHGSGKVPLIPGLTRPCPMLADGYRHEEGIYCIHCGNASGRGQVPVSPAEALAAIMLYAHKQHLRLECEGDFDTVEELVEALAEALAKAKGLVKP